MWGEAIWDFWAPRYERLFAQRFSLQPTRALVREHLRTVAPSPRRILDLGCGVGQLAAELADEWPGAHITAIDPAPGMIARATRDYARPHVTFAVGALETLATDDPFDVIVSTHAFPYIPAKAAALQRLHGLLTPGGRLLLVQGHVQTLYDALFFLAVKLTVSQADYLSTQALTDLLTAAGFTPGVVRPLPRAWFVPSVYLVTGTA
jgi:trans-aconitate methyltransferase